MAIPLYLSKRFTQEQAVRAINDVVGENSHIAGKACEDFEKELCRITGAAYATAAASVESALTNLLAAWSVGDKEAVFVPSFAKPYVLFAVMQCGAVPVLVDCDRETWTISSEKLENTVKKCIKSGELYPRAVIAEDTFGVPFNSDAVNDVCARYGLLLIENVWTAHGAEYKGRKAGTLGDAAVLSFKSPLCVSALCDGGAVLTSNLQLANGLRPPKNVGAETVRRVGYAPMDEITARLVTPQLESIEEATAKRCKNAEMFRKALQGTSVSTIKVGENITCAYPVFPLCAKSQSDAANLVKAFREADIECKEMLSKPLCRQPAFKKLGVQASEMPVGSMLSTCTFVIPCHEGLAEEETEYICAVIKKLCI